MTEAFSVEIHCPRKECRGRFLLETDGGIARSVCPSCGGEVIYRAKCRRDEILTIPRAAHRLSGKAS